MLRSGLMRKAAAIVALLAVCPYTLAWGPEGHRLVARIADTQLTPAAKAKIESILAPGETIMSMASWADETRRARPETGPWHYIDIQITDKHLDMARDCPKGDCVIAKIAEFRKALADPNTPADARREALLFVVHFVGDMHQPLHCSDNHDKGGNDVKVMFFDRESNLHTVWDSGLIGRMEPEDELFATALAESGRHAHKWANGTVEDWANQIHKTAVKVVYGRLPKVPQPLPLSTTYERTADPLIRTEIAKAGARLARVLNESLP
jgi:hypothetical protein